MRWLGNESRIFETRNAASIGEDRRNKKSRVRDSRLKIT